jgi:hypothetical protein
MTELASVRVDKETKGLIKKLGINVSQTVRAALQEEIRRRGGGAGRGPGEGKADPEQGSRPRHRPVGKGGQGPKMSGDGACLPDASSLMLLMKKMGGDLVPRLGGLRILDLTAHEVGNVLWRQR